jgi:hypothetical protein
MLVVTVDSVPWQHEIMQMVWAWQTGRGVPAVDEAIAALMHIAAGLGATGIIGLRLSFTEDVAERFGGTGTHIRTVAYGTAVKW